VSAVTIGAGRDTVFAFRHPLTVNAGHVLRELINPDLRVELAHVAGIAVAPRTQWGDLRAGRA
jgi:hypothetical protein